MSRPSASLVVVVVAAAVAASAAVRVPACGAFAPHPAPFRPARSTTAVATAAAARGGEGRDEDLVNADDVVDAAAAAVAVRSRRDVLSAALAAASFSFSFTFSSSTSPAFAADVAPDGSGLDVADFLRSGMVSQPMGVSGQAGKSKPETGVVLREGSEPSRDGRTGSVLAEIVLPSAGAGEKVAVATTFSSPWSLAKGTVFDVECRDAKTGDGAFLSVIPGVDGRTLSDLPDSFLLDALFSPSGRFSFYGSPTGVKAKKSVIRDGYKYLDLTFANLSQSTQTEIPRNAVASVTIPEGTDCAVVLVGSANSSRWRKGAEAEVRATVESFRASRVSTGLKVRAKERGV